MKNFFLTKLLAFIGKRLDGYKTKIGGVGGILLGVMGIVKLIFPDQLPQLPDLGMEGSLGAISAGFVALGLGGKAEKQTVAIREQNELVKQQNILLEKQTPSGPAVSPGAAEG